uniref:Bromo domain-containing protein n=1 Tax=Kalanchoe fedtschenkoi TaxID=63787 RepID=A0A7N0ZRZ2_KALFE
MPSMTTTEDMVVKKRLRIKYGTKKFETECVVGEVKPAQTVPLFDDWGHSVAVKEKSESVESESYRVPSSCGVKTEESVMSTGVGCKKRGPTEFVEGRVEKRQKMDRGKSQQCSNLLKKLMSHKSGWPFLAPVDPVALCIPDYFLVIKHPMDLGTVKVKLGKNKYDHVDEFAADVRLTFSNAMSYNPPGNYVHGMANELSDLFNRMWKSVEKKLGQDQSQEKSLKLTIGFKRNDSAPKLSVKPPTQPGAMISKSTVQSLETDNLTRPMEVGLAKSLEECSTKIARSASFEGTKGGGTPNFDLTLSKSPLRSAGTVCTLCANIHCCCSAGKDLPSGKSLKKDKCINSPIAHKDLESITKPACQRSNSDPVSNEAGRSLGEKNACHSSNLTTDASLEEEWQTPATESRFAGTILKAQQKKLLDHSDKVDALKIQQQKEILERQQREERIRLEAEIKAAEAAERRKADAERRAQREREREAARIALQKMEKTVEFHETVGALKEIEMLCGCPISGSPIDIGSPEVSPLAGSYSNPLEQLGLFMKEDLFGGDEEDEDAEVSTKVVDGEEGEFIP